MIGRAQAIIALQAEPTVIGAISKLIEREVASWQADPEVYGVVGVIDRRDGEAYVVVYVEEGDFEVSDRLYDSLG